MYCWQNSPPPSPPDCSSYTPYNSNKTNATVAVSNVLHFLLHSSSAAGNISLGIPRPMTHKASLQLSPAFSKQMSQHTWVSEGTCTVYAKLWISVGVEQSTWHWSCRHGCMLAAIKCIVQTSTTTWTSSSASISRKRFLCFLPSFNLAPLFQSSKSMMCMRSPPCLVPQLNWG